MKTWLKDNMDSSSLTMPGVRLERKDRGHGRTGGIACYIRHALMYKILNYMEFMI